VSGKRMKIKAGSVLLRFASPGAGEVMSEGHRLAGELDPGFLWETSDDGEFGFADLAREYYGGNPSPAQSAAVAMLLHASPMHFYKKGKGRYKAAPADALKSALAGAERKRREAEQVAHYAAELQAHRLPSDFRDKLPMLLYKPDKQSVEVRALAAACTALHTHPLALLDACGAITSTHDYHFNGFVAEAFPRGIEFAALPPLPPLPALAQAAVRAFSIDDATTTEIDDAFSVRALSSGNHEIGIHIAAPALLVTHGSALDAIARARLSTVYMPGRKITMLPESVIAQFSLVHGAARPALSLYVEIAQDGTPLAHRSQVESVTIEANLRLDAIGDAFAVPATAAEPPWTDELRTLWRFAQKLEGARGKADPPRIDYNFYVEWDAARDGRITIVPRPRGSPLDKLVAELMIHVNERWGALLAAQGVPGLYRTQQQGKVRMSTRPEPHQGLGVAQYLWASSPLRRYSDLVNQRQLLAVIAGRAPDYAEGDAELFAAMTDFENTYAQYAEFQNRMEHYWCLRWLLQEKVEQSAATVLRDNLVRLDAIPLYLRVPDLPSLAPQERVRIGLGRIDLLGGTLETRYLGPAND